MELGSIFQSEAIRSICKKYHIRQLSVFGSIIHGDFGPKSDIDMLAEFETGYTPGFNFFLIEAELSEILGRKVDLQTAGFLNPEIRHSVLAEAVPIHE